MKLLILFAILGVVAAGGFYYQQPLIRVESRKTKMIKEGTWDAYLKDKKLLQQSFNQISSKNLNDFDELEYVANISIGKPLQPFNVHYDVTAIEFWISDITCGTDNTPTPYCPFLCSQPGGARFCNPKCLPQGMSSSVPSAKEICDQKAKFDSSKSKTFYHPNDPKSFNKDYEFGYISTTFYGQDQIILGAKQDPFGGLWVPLSGFGQTKELSPAFYDTPFDGILGLLHHSDYLRALQSARQIAQNVFTIVLQDTDNKYDVPGGYISFGGIDEEHCSTTEIDYQNATTMNYDFFAGNISYGSTVIQEMSTVTVDTSRASIYGPPDSISKIKDAAGVSEDGIIDCDAKIEDITLNFGMNNAKLLTIPAENLIIKNPDGTCTLAVDSLPPLKAPDNNKWIFGTPWFWSYCNVFSFEVTKEKIGFAKIIA